MTIDTAKLKPREPVTHYLKIYPDFFSAVCTGVKRAELRKNDRDYRVGDTLHLMETPRGCCSPTGEYINATVTHVADVSEWLPGYVLLSIEREPLYATPQPVAVRCPFPCGWEQLNADAVRDTAFLAINLIEGDEVTDEIWNAVQANNNRLLNVIAAARRATSGKEG
ncbi:DUF3850 domain-containing protein [Cronobacter sakazakii]|nr:DUF3850 domain-containing protein [Cronobacter sakazakii]